MTSKPKLIGTLMEFQRISEDAQKIAEKPSSRRIRTVFSRLLWESELNKIIYKKAMPMCIDPEFFFEEAPPQKVAEILTISMYRGQSSARNMTSKLEWEAGRYGYEISIAEISRREALDLPGFIDFVEDCLVPVLVPLKAQTKEKRESYPIIFSPQTFLVQKKEGTFIVAYDPENSFSELFKGLAFR